MKSKKKGMWTAKRWLKSLEGCTGASSVLVKRTAKNVAVQLVSSNDGGDSTGEL
jgi:ribosomal protein L18